MNYLWENKLPIFLGFILATLLALLCIGLSVKCGWIRIPV